jgi:hypothetical protein
MRYYKISKEMSSLYFRLAVFCLLEPRVQEFGMQPPPLWTVLFILYTEYCVKFWDFSFEFAEYIEPKIQRRHLFADLRIAHLWLMSRLLLSFYHDVNSPTEREPEI